MTRVNQRFIKELMGHGVHAMLNMPEDIIIELARIMREEEEKIRKRIAAKHEGELFKDLPPKAA